MHIYRGGSVRDHLLSSYRNSFAAIVLRQLQDKGFRDGMQAGIRNLGSLTEAPPLASMLQCASTCVCNWDGDWHTGLVPMRKHAQRACL